MSPHIFLKLCGVSYVGRLAFETDADIVRRWLEKRYRCRWHFLGDE